MPSDAGPLRVGVTGGIGSGKSTVCVIFEELGRPVFHADPLSKEIAEEVPAVRQQITDLLGAGAYRGPMTLDRQYVASRIFTDARLRKRLEAILHPAVVAEINRRLLALPAATALPYVVVEAALIYEARLDRQLDYVVVVDADEQTRVKRVMARESISGEEVAARIASQLPADEKVRRADFVIRNDGELPSLREKVLFIHRLLAHMRK